MKALFGAMLAAVALSACSMQMADSDTSGQAFVRDTQAADCDRRARGVTDVEEGTGAATSIAASQPWSSATEWATATAGSKAQIERDIRWRHYQECVGLVR